MNHSGTTAKNDKEVIVMFNPGWGEPGEWYIQFSDGSGARIDNVEGMRGQQGYLDMLSADKYRDEIIKTNWSTVGSKDDVVRIVLEHVGYNEANKQEDLESLKQAGRILREYVKAMTTGIDTIAFSLKEYRTNSQKFARILKEIEEMIEICHDRIRVYEALKDGKTVGMGWSNESFLRDFPDSPYVPRVKQLMQEMQSQNP